MSEAQQIIDVALARGQAALSEHDSKRLLACFGVPVNREVIVTDPAAAAAEAVNIGFPIVLKASGPSLFHKTELGAIALNLISKEDVIREGQRLLRIKGCEALLVQEMVKGNRELLCGLTRDAQLGPCVMFGLGGILSEILEDVAFRMAPLTLADAQEMMQEIRSKKILNPFRGEAAVDLNIMGQILVGLGNLGLQYEAVHEVDLNPLIIRPDGKPVAVDALVVFGRHDYGK